MRRAGPPLQPPLGAGEEVLPDHEVVALLVRGRRTDTYDAWSLERECRCVVKVVRHERRAEADVVAGLRREAEVLLGLAHPHLARAYAAYDDPPALVLEVLPGATLDALVEDEPLDLPDVAGLALQLTSVLGYLHRSGWLHLDLKPANVVVDHGRATLIDLGHAAAPGRGRRGAGTPGYLAPEQARGDVVGPATDVWGLGVTLLEALTGDQPHGDEATWDSRRRVPLVHRRAPSRPSLPPGLPADAAALLLGCVARDPADRPALTAVREVLAPYARG